MVEICKLQVPAIAQERPTQQNQAGERRCRGFFRSLQINHHPAALTALYKSYKWQAIPLENGYLPADLWILSQISMNAKSCPLDPLRAEITVDRLSQ